MGDINISLTPPEVRTAANEAISNLLPTKSKPRYEQEYLKFMTWCNNKQIKQYSENCLIAYFQELQYKKSLWSVYSMLKSCLSIKHNLDISKYSKLIALIKRTTEHHIPKKSAVLEDEQITKFINEAPDREYLLMKGVSVTVSVLTLTFISIDRWYAICFPLKFKSTTGRAKAAIGIIWFVALAFGIPEMVSVTTHRRVKEMDTILLTRCEPSWTTETDTIFMILKMVLFYVIPLLFMSIAYMQIIRVLWKSGNIPQHMIDVGGSRQVNTFAMNMNASTEGQLKSRRKAAKMLVCVVVMFALCYLPVHLHAVLRLVLRMSNSEGNRYAALISHWLCYANSAVNPIIYNFMSGKFRKEFHRAFEHCCQPDMYTQSQFAAVYHKNHEKDSGIVSRSHSRTDFEIQRVNTYNDFRPQHSRKGTRTSMLNV